MAKQMSNNPMGDLSSFGADFCGNIGDMTLDAFRLWSAAALKVFLSIRRRNIEGSFEELAAR